MGLCSGFSSATWTLAIVLLLIVDRGAAGTCYNDNHLFGYEGWTGIFSEEQGRSEYRVAPIRGMHCSSNWCDKKMLKQGKVSVCAGDHTYWTSEFSTGDTARQCNDGYYVSQMQCSGSRCKNVKLLCRRIDSDVCEFTGGTTTFYMQDESKDYFFDDVMTGMSCREKDCSRPTLYKRTLVEKAKCAWPKFKSDEQCKCVTCALCEAGQVRLECGGESAGTCVNCVTGKYREAVAANTPFSQEANECWPCESCEDGKFRDSCGLGSRGSCEPCPAGSYKSSDGTGECDACDAGTYQPGTSAGASFCFDCAKGTFEGSKGSSACWSCSPGEHQNVIRATACRDCLPGQFSLNDASIDCIDCGLGEFQDQSGQSYCKECVAGEYGPARKADRCWPCEQGTYTDQSKLSTCLDCAALFPNGLLECQTCTVVGTEVILPGFCFAGAGEDKKCYDSIVQEVLVGYEPSPSSPLFESSTEDDGCRFCSASSRNNLQKVTTDTPCPSLRCIQNSDGRSFHTQCMDGACVKTEESARECKYCHTCSNERDGCVLRQHHCEKPDGSCGCKIEGECWGYQEFEPGNLCRRASIRNTVPADQCTGQWENEPNEAKHCEGTTVCLKNQKCRDGICHSEAYGDPGACHAGFVCNGGLDDVDNYDYKTPFSSDKCRDKRLDEACDIAEYCEPNGSVNCPADEYAMPSIANRQDLQIIFPSPVLGGDTASEFVSVASFLRMLGEVVVECKDGSGVLLDACPSATFADGSNVQCGSQQRLSYLHVGPLLNGCTESSISSAVELQVPKSTAQVNQSFAQANQSSADANHSTAQANQSSAQAHHPPAHATQCYDDNDLFGYEDWTGTFSAEGSGLSEDRAAPIRGMTCSTNWCDVKMLKQGTSSVCTTNIGSWTPWFSDENNGGQRCPSDHYVSRMQCSGSRCDNVRLFCRQINSDMCEFLGGASTVYMSEENTMIYQFSQVVIGMSCYTQSYCSRPTLIRRTLREKESCAYPQYKDGQLCRCVACAECEAGQVRQGCGGDSAGHCVNSDLALSEVGRRSGVPDGAGLVSGLEVVSGLAFTNAGKCKFQHPVRGGQQAAALESDLALSDAVVSLPDGTEVYGIVQFQLYGLSQDDPSPEPLCSSKAIVDNSPPPSARFEVHDVVESGHVFYHTSRSSARFSWHAAGWIDPHSGMSKIVTVFFRCSQQAPEIIAELRLTQLDQALAESANVSFAQQDDGSDVFAQFIMVNGVGLATASPLVHLTIDASPPSLQGMLVIDGGSDGLRDLDFQATRSGIQACWNLSAVSATDPHSGIREFVVIAEERRVASSVWKHVAGPCVLSLNASSVSFTNTMCPDPRDAGVAVTDDSDSCLIICLEHGAEYRVGISVVNGAGLTLQDDAGQQQWIVSNGRKIDTTEPQMEASSVSSINPLILDNPTSCSDVNDVQGSGSDIAISWLPVLDIESVRLYYLWEIGEIEDGSFSPTLQTLNVLGVTTYDSSPLYGPQTRPLAEKWAEWSQNCTDCLSETWPSLQALTARQGGLSLQHGMTVYVRLWCVNDAGLASSALSAGITVDLTSPDGTEAFVNDVLQSKYDDAEHVAFPNRLHAFASNFRDCESVSTGEIPPTSCGMGIRSIQYGFGTQPGLDDVVATSKEVCYNDGPQIFSANVSQLLAGGQRYFALAVVCNRGGLCRNFTSDGIIADFTIPSGGHVVDGRSVDADLNFVPLTKSICAAWTNFTDAESGIAAYEVTWGRCSDVSANAFGTFVPVGLNSSYCFPEVDVAVETVYCSVVRTTNRAGIPVLMKSDGFLVCGPPIPGLVVGGSDPNSPIKFQSNTETITVSWTGFRDSGAPFVSYRIALFESGRGDEQETLFHGPVVTDSFRSWSFNTTLVQGNVYKAEVCVYDVLDQQACSNSSRIIIDVTPPVVGSVFCGPTELLHTRYLSDPTALQVSWTRFDDSESGLDSFQWALGSTAGHSDIMDFQGVGLKTRGTAALTLRHGDRFYITVKATNGAGMSAASSSEQILVHTKRPIFSLFHVRHSQSNAQKQVWNSSADLEVWWEMEEDGLRSSAMFPALKMWMSIGSIHGQDDVYPQQQVGFETPLPFPQLGDGRFVVSMIAEDILGRMDYRFVPLVIDASPPSLGILEINGNTIRVNVAATTQRVYLKWGGFNDAESGIETYLVGLGTAPGHSDIVAFVDVGTVHNHDLRGPFPQGRHFVSVVARNGAGVSVSASVSVSIDATQPVPAQVREVLQDSPMHDIDCVDASGTLHTAWDAFTDQESGIARYEVAVVCMAEGSAPPCGEARFHDVGLGLSWTTEADMEEGRRYQVVVRGWNRAGMYSEAVSNGFTPVIASHQIYNTSATWLTLNLTTGMSSRTGQLATRFQMTYPINQPIPDIEIGFGQCERCDDLLHFTPIVASFSANQSTHPGFASDEKPVLVGGRTWYDTCSDGTACNIVNLILEWAAPTPRPYFFVVKATSCSDRTTFATVPIPAVDTSPPQAGVVRLQSSNFRWHYTADGDLPVSWTGFNDAESGIETYLVGLGTAPGHSDIVAFVDVGTVHNHDLRGPFPQGRHFVSVVARNGAGVSVSASVSVSIDATQPVPAQVREVLQDSPMHDIDCVDASGTLHTAWDAFTDEESGIARYEVAVVCMAEGSAPPCGEARFHDVGLGLSWTTEADMEEGRRYQVVVRGWNRAGMYSEAVSNGVQLLPSGQKQFETQFTSDGLWTTKTGVIAAGRISILDPDNVLHSIEYGVGSIEGSTSLQGWTQLFKKGEHTSSIELNLDSKLKLDWKMVFPSDSRHHGLPIYATFRTATCSGKISTESHFVGTIDITPPLSSEASATVETFSMHSSVMLSVQWSGFDDPESGVKSFSVGIGSDPIPRLEDVANFTRVGLDQSFSLVAAAASSFTHRTVVYVAAWNGAGLFSIVSAEAGSSMQDPPVSSTPQFVTLAGHTVHMKSVSANQQLRVIWDGFVSHSCGMKQYDYAIVCDASTTSPQMQFRSVGMNTNVLITHQSVQNEMCDSIFRIHIRGWDRCGLSSTAMTNSLEYVSHETPRILAVLDGQGPHDDEDFTRNHSLSATALVENCGPFCTVRCGLGVFPFVSSVAELSENWASSWAESEAMGDFVSMMRCSFLGIELQQGRKYFAVLQIQFGDETLTSSSNGTVIDWTPPGASQVKVRVDDLVSSDEPVFVTSNSTLSVSWTEFQEPESGPLSLWIAIATSCDAAQLPYHHSGQVTSLAVEASKTFGSALVPLQSNQHVVDGTTLCVCLNALNRASLRTSSCVNIQVDNSSPLSGTVYDGADGFDAECQRADDLIMASWSGFESHLAPIVRFEWAAGTCPFCSDLVGYTQVALSTSNVRWRLDQHLRMHQMLWTSVRATNAAGRASVATSNGIRVACSGQNCSLTQDTTCI